MESLEARRLFAAGELDLTFGGDGRVTTDLGLDSAGADVVVQSDGKMVVAGVASSPSGATTDAVLIRYNVNGSLDTTFGTNGVTRVDFGGNELFRELVLLPNGKFVAGGQQSDTHWMLARFTANGQLDAGSGFGGTDGVQTGAGEIWQVALQGSNIITAASSNTSAQNIVRRHVGSTGAVDATFGAGGSVVVSSAIPELANFVRLADLVVQGNGKILITGISDGKEGDPEELGGDARDFADRVMALGRLTANGAADGSFATNGGLRKGLDEEGTSGHALAVRAGDDAIFVATTDGGQDANLLQLSPTGTIVKNVLLPARGEGMGTSKILFDAQGHVIVAGHLDHDNYQGADSLDFVAVRFTSALERDLTFGEENGESYVDFSPAGTDPLINDFIGGAALDPQGRIILAGRSREAGRVAVARLVTSSVDPTTASSSIVEGVLVGRGTGGNDTILLANSGTIDTPTVTLTINGVSSEFSIEDFVDIRLEGLGGDDQFILDGLQFIRPPVLLGGAGNDTFGDRDRDDDGRVGEFIFFGGSGDDFVRVPENDYPAGMIHGGDGNDTIRFAAPTPSDGSPTVFTMTQFDGFENGIAVRGTLIGTGGPNRLEMLDGGIVQGMKGDDTIVGGDGGADRLEGGEGNDLISGGNGNDTLDGGAGTDTLNGGTGVDTLLNGEVNDQGLTLSGFRFEGSVLVFVGTGADEQVSIWQDGENLIIWLDGNTEAIRAADVSGIAMDGFGGNDLLKLHKNLAIPATLQGGEGDDKLIGGAGDDRLWDDFGNDHMTGGAGNDTLNGGRGADTMIGGAGKDTADYSQHNVNLVIGLDAFADDGEAGENDLCYLDIERVLGGRGNDRIGGSASNNELYGNDGNDTISGGGGADALFGAAGNDKMHGGDGDDYLEGGAGHDTLYGGAGGDTLMGLAGNDRLLSDGDGENDTVNGGIGTDSGDVDDLDDVSSIELLI